MKRKNILNVFAVAFCTGIIAFTGCGGEKDPYTVYSEAAKKTAELTSMESSSKTSMTLSMAELGFNMDIALDMDTKLSGINSDKLLADMAITMNMLGESMDIRSYYQDGYYYTTDGSVKTRYPMDMEELEKQVVSSASQMELKKEDFKDISMEKKDGEYHLSYTVKSDSMNGILDSIMGSIPDALSLDDLGMELQVSDISGTAVVNKDGYFTQSDLNIPISMEAEGQALSFEVAYSTSYVNPGKEVTVELPDDLDTYTDTGAADDSAADDSSTTDAA